MYCARSERILLQGWIGVVGADLGWQARPAACSLLGPLASPQVHCYLHLRCDGSVEVCLHTWDEDAVKHIAPGKDMKRSTHSVLSSRPNLTGC